MTEKLTPEQIISRVRWSDDVQPFEYLIDTGLLYQINKTAIHHFGFKLEIVLDEEGAATGFKLLGDGTRALAHDTRDPEVRKQAGAFALTMGAKIRDDGQAL